MLRRVSSSLSSDAIRGWIGAPGRQVDTGLSRSSALELAQRTWEVLVRKGDCSDLVKLGSDLPDVLYALVSLVQQCETDRLAGTLQALRSIPGLIEDNLGAFGDELEAYHLAASFAYLAWSSSRRQGLVPEARSWEGRCAAYVMAQADANAFLRLNVAEKTEGLTRRFLSEPTTVLAICWSLANDRNRAPARVARDAEATFRWLWEHGSFLGNDDQSYFCGDLAFSLVTALRHLGRYGEADRWTARAAACFRDTASPEPWIARVELLRATILFDKHLHVEVLRRLPSLLEDLARFGLTVDSQRGRLLQAVVLKDMERRDEALDLLLAMLDTAEVRDDSLVHGLVLANIGEIRSSQGHFAAGMASLSEAVPLLKKAATPWAFANLQGTIAEVLRDNADIVGAISAFQSAVSIYTEQGMEGKACYVRVLLAQCLAAAGRDNEATQELLVALSHFDKEAVAPDALAAIALLRESIRRQKADPEALRALRQQIQKMGEVEQ
jgi:tetratricopeptide (TPR) repeat protein